MKLLTVIVPTYNVEKYIINSINSILQQDFNDFVIIIVDDASTDNTVKLVNKSFTAEIKNGKILLIEQECNGGPATSRQKALDCVTTPYVTFMDADDRYNSRDALQIMVEAIKKTDSDIVLFKYITDHGNIKLRKNVHIKNNTMNAREAFIERVCSDNPIWHYLWNKVYKTSVIKDNNVTFQYGLRGAEDVRFNEDLFPYLKNVYFLDEYLYVYNCTNSQSLTKKKSQGHIDQRESVMSIWHRECEHYDRVIKTICVPLNCIEECESILRLNLCNILIRQIKTITDRALADSIRTELLKTNHGKLISPIYKRALMEYEIDHLKTIIKTFVKKLIKH